MTHASAAVLCWLGCLGRPGDRAHPGTGLLGGGAKRYGISAALLYAVARVESNLNPQAINHSHLQRTGSYDIGLMQINSGHLRTLSRHGIKEADLFDPCTNIRVGAWLLADSTIATGFAGGYGH